MENKHDKDVFVNHLLDWYDKNARILPWREDCSSYRIWVSEIMLQQTRVEAVKPYFERFLKALPSLLDLANAKDDDLAKLWEGLGYYNRVRNMKKCAIECIEKYGGELPHTYEELLTLPGIGAYTAGAVASIAYGECVPAVDGNVLRVFSRVLVSEEDVLKESTKKSFQRIIQLYIPEDRCADFNQAVMELGAMICVPNAAPRCNICPVAQECLGYLSGQAHRLPNKKNKKTRRIEKKTVLVILCKQEVLLHQRPQTGLLAGLYEFIVVDGYIGNKEIANHLSSFKIIKKVKLNKAKHIFSHIEWHMNGYLIEVEEKSEQGNWVTLQQVVEQYALPTALKTYKEALIQWVKEN